MTRFSAQVEDTLRRAGWYSGRQVRNLVDAWRAQLLRSDGFEMFPSAERALLEFGGLKIDQQGTGQTCARESFALDPTVALYENDRFGDFVAVLNTRLYPLGEAVGGHYFLTIGENERVYLLMQNVELLGNNIDEALENLIVGVETK